MTNYLSPLSVVFVWHPEDKPTITPIVDYCFSLLSRDITKPFSRSVNLPIFYRSANQSGLPASLDIVSEKTIIFAFLTKEIASNEDWINYIKEASVGDGVKLICIALDKAALTLCQDFGGANFIRAYEYGENFKEEYIFIAIAHEIYRYALNENFIEKSLGKENALRIFLSHAKDGENGVKLAKSLKKFIDDSSMQNFFDATDIAAGYKFDDEIIRSIKNSTIIAIHSDIYSSRYWCQREILSAKEYERPIVAVDTLEEYEDRRFPFATNVPGIHVHIADEPSEKDMLRILCSALLETIRFFYSKLLLSQYKICGYIDADAKICPRPPEVSDIEKIITLEDNSIKPKFKAIIYPEPPLYNEELSFLSKLGIKVDTPLTIDKCTLQGKRIGVSISELSTEELMLLGQDSKRLTQLSQDIGRHLLAREAELVYGGDLRPDGFTKFLFDEAEALKVRLQSDKIHINNYIAWPIYKKDTDEMKEWKSIYRHVASMPEISLPEDVKDLIPVEERNSFLHPTNPQNTFVWSRSLTEMRHEMIKNCDIRISAAGKHSGYKGKMPGVLEEILIAINYKKPLFLLGGFGGVTASVCNFIKSGILPQELSLEWQINNNNGYYEMLEFSQTRGFQYSDEYKCFAEVLKMENLNNGLSPEDNTRLFNTPFIDEALYLIFKGIKNLS